MKSYTVHQPPNPAAERLDRAESLVFVKDGFNVFAAFLTPIWLLANRLWLELFVYLVLAALIFMIVDAVGMAASIRSTLFFGLNILIGFEADSIRRWSLARKGWQLIGTVTGENPDVCERRFFENWLPTMAAVDANRFSTTSDDPFASATAAPRMSNLGVVRQPAARPSTGWFGGWRSKR